MLVGPAVTSTHVTDVSLWELDFNTRDTSGMVSTLSMVMEITLDEDALWITPHLVLSGSQRINDKVWKHLAEKMLQYGVEKQPSGHRTMRVRVSDDPRSHQHEKTLRSTLLEEDIFQWYAHDFRTLDMVIPDTVSWILHNILDVVVKRSRMFVNMSASLMMLARTFRGHVRPASEDAMGSLPGLLWDICCVNWWSRVDVLDLVTARVRDPNQYEALVRALVKVKHVRCSWERP